MGVSRVREGNLTQLSRMVDRIAICCCIAALLTTGCIRKKKKPGAESAVPVESATATGGRAATPGPAAPGRAPGQPVATAEGAAIAELPVIDDCPRSLGGNEKVARTIRKECGPITITRSYFVNGSLTLEAGVVLKFQDRADLRVGMDGPAKLFVRGTASDPVIMTSAGDAFPGAWQGVELLGGARSSQISGLVIENAGQDNLTGALNISAGNVTLVGSTIRNAKGFGLRIETIEPFAALSGNTFDHAGDVAIRVTAEAVGSIGTNFFGPGEYVKIEGGNVSKDARWQNPGAPYLVAGMIWIGGSNRRATLEIAAGTEFRMHDADFIVGNHNDAGFIVSGTPDRPVVFTGDEKRPGRWHGISVGNHGEARIANATISCSGTTVGTAALRLDGGTLTVTGTTFDTNLRSVDVRGGTLDFDHNRIAASGEPAMKISADLVGGLGSNNTYDSGARIEVLGGILKESATWRPQSVPYQIMDSIFLENNAALTLQPGVDLAFVRFARLEVGSQGQASLKAVGTPDRPIVLRAQLGNEMWSGVVLAGRTTSAELANVVISDTRGDAAIAIGDGVPAKLTAVRCVRCPHELYSTGCRSAVTASDVVTDGTPTNVKPVCPR